MQHTFSLTQLLSRRASAAAERVRMTPLPANVISFSWGVPDTSSLPLRQLSTAAITALVSYGVESMQYGPSQGDPELRRVIARREGQRQDMSLTPEQVVVTNGGSHALDLLCEALLEPGDVALTDAMAYPFSLSTLRAHEAELVGIPLDAQGLDVDALAKRVQALARAGKRVKFLYTAPDFQNPTATVMPRERREAIAKLARDRGFLIIEDTASAELRYEGDPQPSLLLLAGEMAVQAGTFTKTLGPGLRLGWVVAGDPQLADIVAGLRRDMGTSPLLSRLIASYINAGEYQPHLHSVLGIYTSKRNILHAALIAQCSQYLTWEAPQGGFFLWAELKSGKDARDLAPVALEEGVAIMPAARFMVEERPSPSFRLAFSALSASQIQHGVERLAKAIGKFEASRS